MEKAAKTGRYPTLWTAAACCSFPFHSLLWNEDTESIKPLFRVVWQQAAGTKAAAGCRSPKGAIYSTADQ